MIISTRLVTVNGNYRYLKSRGFHCNHSLWLTGQKTRCEIKIQILGFFGILVLFFLARRGHFSKSIIGINSDFHRILEKNSQVKGLQLSVRIFFKVRCCFRLAGLQFNFFWDSLKIPEIFRDLTLEQFFWDFLLVFKEFFWDSFIML